MDQYQHNPLPTPEHIRFVTIRAGRFDDDILLSYDILAFASDGRPSYDALSYTWDTHSGSRLVYVIEKGKTWAMHIPRNLAEILVYLRYADKARVMWIDALCIDQTNDVEKGPQVARMGKVYRSAHRISIWLGKEENDSTRALNTMLWLGSKVTVDWDRLSVALRPEYVEPGFEDVNMGVPLRPEDTEAIYHLFSRRWFERLWIRQEVMLAEATAVVQCGFYQVPWPPFRRALVCLYQKPRPKTPFDEKLNNRLLSFRGLMSQASTVPLGYIRVAFGQSDCTDARDRIYALCEFLSEGDKAVVGSPDYTKDADVIFRDIVRRYIQHYGSLNILSQCQINPEKASDISWTPDWTKKNFIYGRSYWRGFASSHFGAMCAISENGRVLKTPGASITTVEDLEDIPAMEGRHIGEQVLETLRILVPSDKLEERYVTGVSMLEAYARTSVANALRDKQEPWLGEDPTLEEAQEIILDALKQQDQDQPPSKTPSGHTREVYKIMRAMLAGRRLMHGSGGYIGTVPEPTQKGDEICVLLGCHTPMVLRRVRDDVFRIVGECYVLGISEGEALLGPLPDGIRRVFASDPKSGVHSHFVNDRTGDRGLMDPRIQKFSLGLETFPEQLSEDPNAKIQLRPEQLRSVFPQMREFDII
ncbi:heterokaryon incompatibility protein-domain-containing protein [Hypoxylon sp. FL0543]|nr:heterokaryon incompatibility protein-domain-containing protein [Hypoxylon sp. FL0543]